jgi:hypothetical protein
MHLRVSFARLMRADCKEFVYRKEIEDFNYVLTFEAPLRSNVV